MNFEKFASAKLPNDNLQMITGGIACNQVNAVIQHLVDIGNPEQALAVAELAVSPGFQCDGDW